MEPTCAVVGIFVVEVFLEVLLAASVVFLSSVVLESFEFDFESDLESNLESDLESDLLEVSFGVDVFVGWAVVDCGVSSPTIGVPSPLWVALGSRSLSKGSCRSNNLQEADNVNNESRKTRSNERLRMVQV